MAKQRARSNGEGTVYQRKDGRWTAALYIEGKRYYFYGKTKKEAEQKRRAAILEQERGEFATGGNARQTVGQFFNYWLEVKRAGGLRPTSRSTYERVRTWILPHIGHVQLKKLTPAHIQALYSKLQSRKLAAGSIRTVHSTLRSALRDAVKWRLIGYSPLQHVTPPRAPEREYVVLDPYQAGVLMYAARNTPLECMIVLAVTVGLRRGELLALRWDDIDLDAKKLQVRHNAIYLTLDGESKFFEGPPKSSSGKRTLSLPDIAVDALKAQRTRQREARMKTSMQWQDRGLVFCTRTGNFINKSSFYRWFNDALRKALLKPMRFHELRHSAATILLSMGVPIKVVQEILGHANIQTTLNIYGHMLPGLQEKAMGQVDDLYKNKRQKEAQ